MILTRIERAGKGGGKARRMERTRGDCAPPVLGACAPAWIPAYAGMTVKEGMAD